MSRTRRMVSGAGIAYLHQAAVAIVGLWLTPLLLEHVGQRALGLWLVTGQVLGYLTLLDLGVIAILPREVALAQGLNEPERSTKVGELMARVRRIVRWQTIVIGIVALVLWYFLPAAWLELRWPLALVLVAFVALYPARIPIAALQGSQDLSFLAVTQFVGWALSTGVTVVLVLRGFSLFALVCGWVLSIAVPALAALYRARNRWVVPADVEHAPVKTYLSQSLWVSVSQISQVLTNGSDMLLLGRILGAAAVVPYACTGKLVTVFANHPSLLMHAAQPALTELRVSASRERLSAVATALAQSMLILSGGLVVAILPFNRFFVNWWMGPDQYGGTLLTIAFVTMMVVRHWNVAATYTLFCFGYERQLSLTGLADGVLSAVLTTLLVWRFGLVGAPLASTISALTVSLPMNLRSIGREMQVPVRHLVMSLVPLFARIAAVGAASMWVSIWMGPPSLARMAALLAATAVAYIVVVLPLAWNGPMGPYLRRFMPFLERGTTRTVTVNGAPVGEG